MTNSDRSAKKRTRRRFLSITALAGLSGATFASLRPREKGSVPAWAWHGVLFGADASINLHGIGSESTARELTESCFSEMRRLEQMFSLFVPESVVCQLNRKRIFRDCPPEFVELVAEAKRMHRLTDGAFDVTVQPLWETLNGHDFQSGPIPKELIEAALSIVDGDKIDIAGRTVALGEPGMAITLNGIAQGFITDRISEHLRRNGVRQALVNMGEYRAIGLHREGRAWELGIRPPGMEVQDFVIDSMPLENRALAVSGGYGYTFDARGRRHHLLHPRTGVNEPAERSVAVIAPSATLADALSTACGVIEDDAACDLCSRLDCEIRIYRGGDRLA